MTVVSLLQRNLGIRVLSAVVLAPLTILLAVVGDIPFLVLLAVVGAACAWEWSALVGSTGATRVGRTPVGFGGVALTAVTIAAPPVGLLATLFLGIWPALVFLCTVGLVSVAVTRLMGSSLPPIAPFGIVYVGVPFCLLFWLRGIPEIGLGLVLWLCFIVWATDIGAYAVGRLVGGPRLAPSISPNKTWSGTFGGAMSAVIVGAVVAIALAAERPLVAAALALVVSITAQLGDLFESMKKRQFGVKDSSRLIPGHGGVLDRVDGLLAAVPVFALFQALTGETLAWL